MWTTSDNWMTTRCGVFKGYLGVAGMIVLMVDSYE